MQGFEMRFNVYAQTQGEADLASEAVKQFITGMAQKGIAVTASKITDGINKWKDNYFVTSYFK